MAPLDLRNNFLCALIACILTAALGQNIIKDLNPTVSSIADLSGKVNDLKPDGSNYGLGYYGTAVPSLGLNYGQSIIAAAPYAAKPYYPTGLTPGYYPQTFAVPGKVALPYNGYIHPGHGYQTNFGFGSGVGVGYPGVLGYNSGYDHHTVLPPHGFNTLPYNTGYIG